MSASTWILTVLLIGTNAFFVAFEFSIVQLEPGSLSEAAEEGDGRAAMVLRQVQRMDGYLAACQLGITISSLSLTAVFQPAFQTLVSPYLSTWMAPAAAAGIAAVVAIFIATSLQVIFGELFPKSLALTLPRRLSFTLSPLMYLFYRASTPFNLTYNAAANWIVERITGENLRSLTHEPPLDVEVLLSQAYETGQIDAEQKELMDAIVEYPAHTAREVMTPATQVVGLTLGESREAILRKIRTTRHSRYPVFKGSEPVAYVKIHDLFSQHLQGVVQLESVLRELDRVPETVELETLWERVRVDPIIAVYDEFDQFVGIVTDEDVAEEIVGEIRDEGDLPEQQPVQHLEDDTVVIDGRALIEDVTPALALELEPAHIPEGVDTFGGLLLAHLKRQPASGDRVEIGNWLFTVEQVRGFTIQRIKGKEMTNETPAGKMTEEGGSQ